MVKVNFIWKAYVVVPRLYVSGYESSHMYYVATGGMSDSKRLKTGASAFAVYQGLKIKEEEQTAIMDSSSTASYVDVEDYTWNGDQQRSSASGSPKKKKRKTAHSVNNELREQRPKKSDTKWNGKKRVSKRQKVVKKRPAKGRSNKDGETRSNQGGSSEDFEVPATSKRASSDVYESISLDGNEDGGVFDSPFFSQFDPDSYEDSRVAARNLFRLLIYPLSLETFYSDTWEKKPVLLKRKIPYYNNGWFSSEELDQILREHSLEFTTNIDITSYVAGQRVTHNPHGRAYPSTVWNYFKAGNSIRLLNPQSYSNSMWLLNSTLQEHFNSCVGANVYMTPAGTQGFAPHYDDIEAFVMQLEGSKRWRLYPPIDNSELLPRYSSSNLCEWDLGKPILDVVLEQGDLLYFPRGTIHQANALPDIHSLHVTVSTFQKNTWGDLLTTLIPAALEMAQSEDITFREGLPVDYLNFMGVVNSDTDDPRRKEFLDKVGSLMSRLIQYAPVDAAVDQMGADHVHSSLPPCLTQSEQQAGVWETGAYWESGEVVDAIELTDQTKVKLVRYGIIRLVMEEDGPMLYFSTPNSRVYREKDLEGMYINEEVAPAVEHLIQSYPEYVTIGSLPIQDSHPDENLEKEIELCRQLYQQGIIFVKNT